MNTLRIRDQVHVLDEVLLYLSRSGSRAAALQFTLFADTDDLKQAGFAINCMNVRGITRIDHVRFELGPDSTDWFNELSESVICEPGAVLELVSLQIAFGPVQNGFVTATLKAVCEKAQEKYIPVIGVFAARIVQEEGPFEPTSQLILPV